MNQYEAEDLILALADSILELRHLRKENAELREIRKEYNTFLTEQVRASEEMSRALFEGIMLGVISKPRGEQSNES